MATDADLVKRVVAAHSKYALPVVDCSRPSPLSPSDDVRLRLQREAILQLMTRAKLADAADAERRCIVEFGAGEGALSQTLWQAGVAKNFVLVDRSKRRMRRAGTELMGFAPQQLCMDVGDLEPAALRRAVPGECVVLSNHMCGSALDLSVQCATADSTALPVGIVAVTCCHHICTWETYLGRDLFRDAGLGKSDFESMRRWSRMAPRRDKPPATRQRVVETAEELGLTLDQCVELGSLCRQLLDTGRARQLERHGFSVALIRHVPFTLSAYAGLPNPLNVHDSQRDHSAPHIAFSVCSRR